MRIVGAVLVAAAISCASNVRIERSVYRDKLEGSLIGQLFGVAWGFANGIEFRYRRRTVPLGELPNWREVDLSTAFQAPAGDDVYCEFSALLAMQKFGPQVSWEQMTPFYRDTEYPLWHSDRAMRRNLQRGVHAPACGHYKALLDDAIHGHADDLDAQMQADFCGTTNPGNPRGAIAQAWKFGHMMNFGDGAIGAAVIASMNAEAFVATRIAEIVRAGVAAAPAGSLYRALLEDVITWHARWPEDWRKTWSALDRKWGACDRCVRGRGDFNIDAKLHGGFILIGLLYGRGDFLESLRTTIRCGQDTDTSAQNVGSILGAFLGRRRLPEDVVAKLDTTVAFEGTKLRFTEACDLIESLARGSVELAGGRVEREQGTELWIVPRRRIDPPILEQWPSRLNDAPQLAIELAVEGRTVVLQARAADDDGIRAVQWHFGDLDYADGERATHTYRRDGVFELVCYVTDGVGNTRYRRRWIRVQGKRAGKLRKRP